MSNIKKKYDLPAFPFYVGDWLKCPEVRALPPDYRGLWFDLLCYMWESTERGIMIKPNGKPYNEKEIIRMVGLDNQNSGQWLTTLIENGVCGKRESDGAIFSRKMIRDEEIRIKRKQAGKLGGNPKLLNQVVNHKDKQNTENENEYEIESKYENDIDIVINTMNKILETNYKLKTITTRKFIRARLKEGFTIDQLISVIEKKKAEWIGTNQEIYLRPATLFNATKFEGYLNQKTIRE